MNLKHKTNFIITINNQTIILSLSILLIKITIIYIN